MNKLYPVSRRERFGESCFLFLILFCIEFAILGMLYLVTCFALLQWLPFNYELIRAVSAVCIFVNTGTAIVFYNREEA